MSESRTVYVFLARVPPDPEVQPYATFGRQAAEVFPHRISDVLTCRFHGKVISIPGDKMFREIVDKTGRQ